MKRSIDLLKIVRNLIFLILVTVTVSCSGRSSLSSRYLTAEKLWTEKKYEGAVLEFDRIVKESPNSALGIQSLWRASMTRSLFLKEYPDALKGLHAFIEQSAQKRLIHEALIEIGEILYSKTRQYQAAIDHYEKLIGSGEFDSKEELFFYYRITRAYIALGKIIKSIEFQERALHKYPTSDLSLKIKLDLAQNWFSIGDFEKKAYPKALHLFQSVSDQAKSSDKKKYLEAQFGKAMVLEEQEKTDEAIEIYKKIENEDEVAHLVKIRIQGINERKQRKKI